jgi:transcriptional antiterminator RfaH
MPILRIEVDRYPDNLFGGGADAEIGARWWVLHTRPRQEKSLARDLLFGRIPFYLPQVEHRSISRGRIFRSRIPLFTGYLFLLGDDRRRVAALATRHVVRALPVVEQEKLAEELAQVHRLIESGAPITPEDRLAPGSPVEICSGPLAGLRGVILRAGTRKRFIVKVDFIHQGASVELDDRTLMRAC